MPSFSFSVRDSSGVLQSGVLEGSSAAAVADQLIGGGNTPIRIQGDPRSSLIVDRQYPDQMALVARPEGAARGAAAF